MPKLKTNRGAAKRFKPQAQGAFKRARANRRHLLTKKSPKRKRLLRLTAQVVRRDRATLRQLIPYR